MKKTKHFKIDVHFVRDKVSKGFTKTVKISSDKQMADIFTKSLTIKQHSFLCSELRLFDLFQL